MAANKKDTSAETASVYLRLRADPCNHYTVDNTGIKTKNPEKHYKFKQIFNGGTKQSQLYNECIFAAIEEEQDLNILTYGTSGSGKTYTLMGGQSVPGLEPGIIPRSIEHIFEKYNKNISEKAGFKIQKDKLVILDDTDIQTEMNLRLCDPCQNITQIKA